MDPRQALRRELRAARRLIPLRQRKRNAAEVAHRLGRTRVFLRAQRIAFYWPADGELDPTPLLNRASKAGKSCYLPLLRPQTHGRRGGKLWFAPFRPKDPVQLNRFGIPEPRSRGHRPALPWNLDLLLMPLVGFDPDCHRLGMGGGFYDRTLAYLGHRRHWRRPRLIGIAHECQRVERIQSQPWDIPLDAVVTERGIYIQGPSHRLSAFGGSC